jgi:hypothetical protein
VSDTEPTANPGADPANVSSPPAVRPAAATTTTTSSNGLTFGFTYGADTYNVQIYAPDQNPTKPQYGFTVTQVNATTSKTTTVASLIYADQDNWEIMVGLPGTLQVDTNLTVNQLNIDLTKGAVSPLS